MQVTDRSTSAVKIHAQMWAGFRQVPKAREIEVVLKPLSQPELGEIRIEGAEFAVGRADKPFASYRNEIRSKLARRHARIVRKNGQVFVEDFESRHGTTVNRNRIGRTQCRLQHGDEICFGGVLSYRIEIIGCGRTEKGLTLTLTPKSGDSGLDILVIAKFPFLVSNATFSRYKSKSEHGTELANLAPLHACISQKGGQAYIEDLGSNTGTFVDGVRLRQHAVPLQDGVVIAFGGKHFVYEVSVARQSGNEPASTDTGGMPAEREPNEAPQAYDKTMFMAAPSSFLQVFCDPSESKDEVAPTNAVVPAVEAKVPVVKRRPRGAMLLLSELASLDVAGDPDSWRGKWWKGAAVASALVAFVLTAYFWGSAERDLKNAVAHGQYARAATLASQLLDKHPNDVQLKARATEAALKGSVPAWLAKVRSHDFDGAKSVLTGISEVGKRDSELLPLVDELDWLGDLERLVSSRGGPEAPIRIYADEDSIERVVGRWSEDTSEHQRELDRIASYVPQFDDWYGEALTHLRRLQSDSTVYLQVIERLKASIAMELQRDNADALVPLLSETAEKYPGLGGLDAVRQDLARYIEIQQEAHTQETGRLFALIRQAHFATPPFQQSFKGLMESGELPPADLLQQYDVATQAWKDGDTNTAFAGLQKISSGPWGREAARELERRQGIATRFAAIQQAKGANDSVDQLVGFLGSLDAEEDVHFAHAAVANLNLQKDNVIARAQDAINRARKSWEEYRSDGAIDASQRIETSISDQFRTRARLLADANRYVQQGFLIYSQVDVARAAQWVSIRDEIESEVSDQRSRLQDLSRVVDPELLRIKLAMLGDSNR